MEEITWRPYGVIPTYVAVSFCERIQQLLGTFYGVDVDVEALLKDSLTVEELRSFQKAAGGSAGVSPERILREAMDFVLNLPELEAILPWRPDVRFVEELAGELEAAGLGPGKLRVLYDPSLIAGFVVRHDGRIYDYSWGKAFIEGYGKNVRTTA